GEEPAVSPSLTEPDLAADAELPAWLADAVPAVEPELALTPPELALTPPEPGVEEETEAGELPAWLAEMQVEGGEEPAVSSSLTEPDLAADAALPGWIVDAAPVAEPARDQADSFVDFESPSEDADGLEEADVPEWLSGLAGLDSEESDAGVTPLGVEEEPPEREEAVFSTPEPKNVEFLPQPEEHKPVAESPVAEAEAAEQAEIPAWLQELGPIPTPVPESITEPAGSAENLEPVDMPTWLRDLKPPGTGPLPSKRAKSLEEWAASDAVTSELDQAEIPTWVQDLRPSGDVRETSSLTFRAEPPVEMEDEGLLAGLRDVLPALSLVDVPDGFQIRSLAAVPSSVVRDGHLWQALLERPPDEEQAVIQSSSKPGWGRAVIRVGVLVLLVLVVLAAILDSLPPTFTQLIAQPPPPEVERLQATVANLQPGDTVILALEYGPAEAAEMTHLTEALLSQLVEREVRVVAVSTLPTGEPLIQIELDWARTQIMEDEVRELVNAGYLPGGSAAVAQFLTDLESPDLLLILSARPARLRWWLEQNALLATDRTPVGVGSSAALGPLAQAYFDLPMVQGGMVGLAGAAAYWQMRGLPAKDIILRMNALVLTQWLTAGVLVVGAGYYLIADRKGRAAE
ncbi:MAG: hypothetical protein K8R89_02315, partial [Anaerolineae bacterium]|nr:hypothetical protein [Anaerolineae bacterium]